MAKAFGIGIHEILNLREGSSCKDSNSKPKDLYQYPCSDLDLLLLKEEKLAQVSFIETSRTKSKKSRKSDDTMAKTKTNKSDDKSQNYGEDHNDIKVDISNSRVSPKLAAMITEKFKKKQGYTSEVIDSPKGLTTVAKDSHKVDLSIKSHLLAEFAKRTGLTGKVEDDEGNTILAEDAKVDLGEDDQIYFDDVQEDDDVWTEEPTMVRSSDYLTNFENDEIPSFEDWSQKKRKIHLTPESFSTKPSIMSAVSPTGESYNVPVDSQTVITGQDLNTVPLPELIRQSIMKPVAVNTDDVPPPPPPPALNTTATEIPPPPALNSTTTEIPPPPPPPPALPAVPQNTNFQAVSSTTWSSSDAPPAASKSDEEEFAGMAPWEIVAKMRGYDPTVDPVAEYLKAQRKRDWDSPTSFLQGPSSSESKELKCEMDTYLTGKELAFVHGDEDLLKLGGDSDNKVIVQMADPDIGSSITIRSALLRLYITNITEGDWGLPFGEDLDLFKMTKNWSERPKGGGCASNDKRCNAKMKRYRKNTTLKMFHSEKKSGHSYISNMVAPAGSWISIDVTDDVQDLIDGKTDNYGWIIKKTSSENSISFCARESEKDCAPRVLIDYMSH